MREAEEQNNQSSIDPTTGQFIPPPLHPGKGQLISKEPFGVIIWTKIPMIF